GGRQPSHLIWQSVMWRPGKGRVPHLVVKNSNPYPAGHDSQTVRSWRIAPSPLPPLRSGLGPPCGAAAASLLKMIAAQLPP
ncbi:hypothetical protein, partial [Microvirga sp. Mcv34]|uniref:hypothetical protein n=1 Tax=Microvirga sp. Mcv34 TaxID=2926016 RepID=UPI0021C9C397